jgi:AcrR family transcriptional regulator
MAQQLKPEIREELLRSAERVFAERGYAGASMSAIAAAAGVSTGNVYRYFETKDALFEGVVSDELAEKFLGLVRKRVRSLGITGDLTRLGEAAQRDEDDLLGFWIAHRLRVVILLRGATGTRFEGFPTVLADELTELALEGLRAKARGKRLRPVVRFTLEQIFENTVRTLGAILASHTTEPAVREAFRVFWSYQLAGLAGLERWVVS